MDLFLSTPSARRATDEGRAKGREFFEFLSTPSARRATNGDVTTKIAGGDFYPRPPRGGRHIANGVLKAFKRFLSTPSARRATASLITEMTAFTTISIHALREEGDRQARPHAACCRNFYPRPPRGGRLYAFNLNNRNIDYFYPRPPRGGRPPGVSSSYRMAVISIHALREEGDQHGSSERHAVQRFLSTPSARRATSNLNAGTGGAGNFYPRPPRGGRHPLQYQRWTCTYFYPRPPRGGRLPLLPESFLVCLFLSTPSARRATLYRHRAQLCHL